MKVAGAEFVPKDLIFASPDSASQATSEGPLPDECTWSFIAETRIGEREDSRRCLRFYYKTTVTLVQSCPASEEPAARRAAERITATNNRCPDKQGRVTRPEEGTTIISSGTTVEGKTQEILRQPDGTRVTLTYDEKGVTIVVAFPDGTRDVLQLPGN